MASNDNTTELDAALVEALGLYWNRQASADRIPAVRVELSYDAVVVDELAAAIPRSSSVVVPSLTLRQPAESRERCRAHNAVRIEPAPRLERFHGCERGRAEVRLD
jgi:hypothetical protein